MAHETLIAAGHTYVVAPDDPVPDAFQWRAFIAGQAREDVTHQVLKVPVKVAVTEPGFVVKVRDDNWFVIYGRGRDCVPLLASQPKTVHLKLTAEHYDDKSLTKTVPQMIAGQYPDLVEPSAAETEMHFNP